MFRSESEIRKSDLDEDETYLYDNVYDEKVEIVELHVGCVDLRWPHQTAKTFWECDCGRVLMGIDDLEDHSESCGEVLDGYFDLIPEHPKWASSIPDEQLGFREKTEGVPNIECHRYNWPLDGHRFEVKRE